MSQLSKFTCTLSEFWQSAHVLSREVYLPTFFSILTFSCIHQVTKATPSKKSRTSNEQVDINRNLVEMFLALFGLPEGAKRPPHINLLGHASINQCITLADPRGGVLGTPRSNYFYFIVVTVRKRSLRRLCFCTCLSVILFTGRVSRLRPRGEVGMSAQGSV